LIKYICTRIFQLKIIIVIILISLIILIVIKLTIKIIVIIIIKIMNKFNWIINKYKDRNVSH
jgi:hypothetical protein